MSPQQTAVAVVVTLAVLLSSFLSFYLAIKRAKRRVSVWKAGSTYMFVRSHGLLGIRTRAQRVWTKELGYDEREAIILAESQSIAALCAMASFILIATVAANVVR